MVIARMFVLNMNLQTYAGTSCADDGGVAKDADDRGYNKAEYVLEDKERVSCVVQRLLCMARQPDQ